MRITDVEAICLRLPEVNERCDGTQDTLIVRVHTDAGITGIGEVDSSPEVAKAIIDAPISHKIARGLRHCIIGDNPLDVTRLWEQMYQGSIFFGRGGAAQQAISGVDMALWDIAGKAMNQPVYQLLGGGFKKKLKAYASILLGDTPEETCERGRRFIDEGFHAVKFGWGPLGESEKSDLAHIGAARRGVGDDGVFMIDAGCCYDVQTAIKRTRQFEEFQPYWLEEPLHADDLEGYRRLTEKSPIQIAAGEQEVTQRGFQDLIDAGVHVLQPDVARVGGPTQALEIGKLAARNRRLCVNHSYKSGVSIAASLHFLAALPNTSWLEYCVESSPLRRDLTLETYPVEDGYVTVPQAPGLGVTLNEDVLEKYRVS